MGVVTIGIILVGLIDYFAAEKNASTAGDITRSAADQIIGVVLIVGQSVMSVFQDIAEELFMQEGEFPATLLLGMEGFFGLIFGLILYFPLASIFGENRSETVEQLKEAKIAGFAVGFTLLVTITGIFNIMATAVTSSMTRNVWKSKFNLFFIVSVPINDTTRCLSFCDIHAISYFSFLVGRVVHVLRMQIFAQFLFGSLDLSYFTHPKMKSLEKNGSSQHLFTLS